MMYVVGYTTGCISFRFPHQRTDSNYYAGYIEVHRGKRPGSDNFATVWSPMRGRIERYIVGGCMPGGYFSFKLFGYTEASNDVRD